MEDSDDEDDVDISASHKQNISHTDNIALETQHADDLELGSSSSPGNSVMVTLSTDVVEESGTAHLLDIININKEPIDLEMTTTSSGVVETQSESDEVEAVNNDIEESNDRLQDDRGQPLDEDNGVVIVDDEPVIECDDIGVLTNEEEDEETLAETGDIGLISPDDEDEETLAETGDIGLISPDDEDEEALAETSDIGVISPDDEEALQEIEDIGLISNDDADEEAFAEIDEVGVNDDAEELQENVGYLELYGDIDDDEGIEIVQATDDESNDDSSSSSADEDEAHNRKKRTTFDTSLPNSHTYMGEDMEELHGRTIHPEGEMVIMPLFFQPGVVLAPGQTLPLNLFHPHPISMMKKVIAADKTFGMMMSKGNQSHEERNVFATIGVTCEIYSVREESVFGVEQMSLKCEGRQRFRILSKQFQMDGVILGKILILPDAPIPPYPKMSLIYSQYNRNAISSQVIHNNFFVKNNKWCFGEARYLAGFNPRHKIVLSRSMAALPGWVYKLYNPYFLMDCLMNEIYSWNSNLNADSIPTDPTDFSHWITANLPLTNEMKIELLEIDSAILRLRRQIELMNKCTTTLACIRCRAVITDKAELFSLSRKGPMSAYVNPGGHVHETVTFYKAKNLALQGRSTTEYSWFPGYAWTVATCKSCHAHMGWKFNADKKGLQPSKFWGLTRAALKPVFKDVDKDDKDDNNDGNQNYPMFNEVMYESNI